MKQNHPLKEPPVTDNASRVPPVHWDDLNTADLGRITENSGARTDDQGRLVLPYLDDELLIHRESRQLHRCRSGKREKMENPLLELITLIYLLNATTITVSGDMIGVRDLKDAHFFQGPHALPIASPLDRFGNDADGFKRAAVLLGGNPLESADAAYRFFPFPKIPLDYLLWTGDEDFSPHLTVLFDRSIESHLSADAIWGLVRLVSDALTTVSIPAHRQPEA